MQTVEFYFIWNNRLLLSEQGYRTLAEAKRHKEKLVKDNPSVIFRILKTIEEKE